MADTRREQLTAQMADVQPVPKAVKPKPKGDMDYYKEGYSDGLRASEGSRSAQRDGPPVTRGNPYNQGYDAGSRASFGERYEAMYNQPSEVTNADHTPITKGDIQALMGNRHADTSRADRVYGVPLAPKKK